MSFSKLSLGHCVLVLTALLASYAGGDALGASAAPQAEPAFAAALAGGGDQVTTSQTGDLSLADSQGNTTAMTNIDRDANGNVTGFTAGLTSYKWDDSEKRYNPTVIEMNYYEFEFLSKGRYKWTKRNANGAEMAKGSLDC